MVPVDHIKHHDTDLGVAWRQSTFLVDITPRGASLLYSYVCLANTASGSGVWHRGKLHS